MKNYTCLPGLELSSVPFPIFPDVSAVAWNLAFYFQNQWVTLPDGEGGGGGTSAATDIWATGMILVNKELIRHYCHFFYGPSLFYYVANHAGNQPPYTDITLNGKLGLTAGVA